MAHSVCVVGRVVEFLLQPINNIVSGFTKDTRRDRIGGGGRGRGSTVGFFPR